MSALRNNRDNSHVDTKLLQKIRKFPGQPILVQTESHESKTIYSNFQDGKTYLNTQRKTPNKYVKNTYRPD